MSEVVRSAFIIDAVHPSEWSAGHAKERIARAPIAGAELAIGNPYGYFHPPDPTTGKKPRFWLGHNIAEVSPEDDLPRPVKEHVQWLHQKIGEHTFALVFHGTEIGAPYVQYNPKTDPIIKAIAHYLGFRRALVADGGLASRTNVLEVELALKDPGITVDGILDSLPEIISAQKLPAAQLEEFKYLKGLHGEDAKACGVPREQEPFTPLAREVSLRLSERLGLKPSFDEIWVSCLSAKTYEKVSGGYWGELCVPYHSN